VVLGECGEHVGRRGKVELAQDCGGVERELDEVDWCGGGRWIDAGGGHSVLKNCAHVSHTITLSSSEGSLLTVDFMKPWEV
jgi:hypothetical protein